MADPKLPRKLVGKVQMPEPKRQGVEGFAAAAEKNRKRDARLRPASASPQALVERPRSVPLTQLPDKPTYRAQCTSCNTRGRLLWRSFKL